MEKEKQDTEHLQGIRIILHDIVKVDPCYTLVEARRVYNTKSELCVNYGLWVLMMCQRRFMDCDQRTLWWEMQGVGEAVLAGGKVYTEALRTFCSVLP